MISLKYLGCLATILLLGFGTTLAQFEGVIDMKVKMHDAGAVQEVLFSMLISKNMVTADMKGGEGAMKSGKFIFRGDKKVLWIISDDKRSYLEIPLKDSDLSQDSEEIGEEDEEEDPETPRLRKTGKKQKILGYNCEEWVAESENEVSNIWGTTSLGSIYEGLKQAFSEMGLEHRQRGWEEELAELKVFPLKIVTSRNGSLTQSQEVTKLESKRIPLSAFEPPSGYKKETLDFDMGKMLKEMQEKMKKRGLQDSDLEDGELEQLMKEMMKDLDIEEEEGTESRY